MTYILITPVGLLIIELEFPSYIDLDSTEYYVHEEVANGQQNVAYGS